MKTAKTTQVTITPPTIVIANWGTPESWAGEDVESVIRAIIHGVEAERHSSNKS